MIDDKIKVHIIYLTNLSYRESIFNELGIQSSYNLIAGDRSPYVNINTNANVNEYKFYKIKNFFLFKGRHRLTLQVPSIEVLKLVVKSKNAHFVFLGIDPHIITSLIYSFLLIIFGFNVSWWGHGKLGVGFVRFLRIGLFKLSNKILVYGHNSEVSKHNKIKSKVRVVGNCMNWSDYADQEKLFNTPKKESNKLKIIFSGRIVEAKKMEILLDSFKMLNIPYEAKIIGEGDKKEDYINICKENNLNVTFTGKKYGEEVKKTINWADVMVIPGKVGLSLVHAYGNGLPVIMHNEFSLHSPEYEVHTMNEDFLFSFGDSKDLTKKLENMFINRLFDNESKESISNMNKYGYYPDLVAKKIVQSLKL